MSAINPVKLIAFTKDFLMIVYFSYLLYPFVSNPHTVSIYSFPVTLCNFVRILRICSFTTSAHPSDSNPHTSSYICSLSNTWFAFCSKNSIISNSFFGNTISSSPKNTVLCKQSINNPFEDIILDIFLPLSSRLKCASTPPY